MTRSPLSKRFLFFVESLIDSAAFEKWSKNFPFVQLMFAVLVQICEMIFANAAQPLPTPLSQGQHNHAQTPDIIHFHWPALHSSADLIVLTQPGQRKRQLESERQ